jgi:hypothetical protein
MKELTSTLLAEGSSDRVLIPLLDLLLSDLCDAPIAAIAMANASIPKSLQLRERIGQAVTLFPSEILFVHRDVDAQTTQQRVKEIEDTAKGYSTVKLVCVIPVRMTEAWLLTEEESIRRAVGNPRGTTELNLPSLGRLEALPDPKEELFRCMRLAVDLNSRRMRGFIPEQHRHKVGEQITDLSKLRKLPSFVHLENQLRRYCENRA